MSETKNAPAPFGPGLLFLACPRSARSAEDHAERIELFEALVRDGELAALGAGLAPALILKLYGQKLSARTTILMMLAGISTVAVWQRAGLDGEVFKLLPGMLAGFLAWPVGQAIDCLIDQPAKPPR